MAGRPRKAPNALAGHRAPRQGLKIVPNPERPPPPKPPTGLLKWTRERWDAYWSAPISDHVDRDSDLHKVESFFEFVDERRRAWTAYRRKRFVPGSMGQLRLNPVWKVVLECEQRIDRLGDELGLSPLARARLGIAFGEAASAMRELEEAMNEPDEPRGPQPIEGEWKPL
jgi:phage terminase small subunit